VNIAETCAKSNTFKEKAAPVGPWKYAAKHSLCRQVVAI
jgi:hypothetical protein